VRDEYNREAVVGEFFQRLEQPFRLGRCQDSSGFIQDEQIDLRVQRLEDLHTLSLADVQFLDRHRGVDIEPVPVGQALDSLRRLLLAEREPRGQRLDGIVSLYLS